MEKTKLEIDYDSSTKKESEQFYINGKRVLVKRGVEVEVDQIVKDIYKESKQLLSEGNRGFDMVDGEIQNH